MGNENIFEDQKKASAKDYFKEFLSKTEKAAKRKFLVVIKMRLRTKWLKKKS